MLEIAVFPLFIRMFDCIFGLSTVCVVFIASHFILSLLIIAVNMCKERDILLAKSVALF